MLINFEKDVKHELLIKERERLRNLYEPSKEDIDNLKRINLDYQISKKNFDEKRHNNISEIREIINTFENKLDMHLGGVSMIADDTITYVKNDIVVFGFGALVFILAVLFLSLIHI